MSYSAPRKDGPDDQRWWMVKEPEEASRLLYAAAEAVDDHTIDRQQRVLDAYCLYGDKSLLSSYALAGRDLDEDAISRNVVANAADAILAEVTQTKPRPMVVTIGGSWNEQQRARKLTYYFDAKNDACSVRELAEQAARDAIIGGLGILRPFIDPGSDEVRVERIFPLNFFVEDHGCVDVSPRSFYVRHLLDRWHAMQLWPDHAELLERAPGPSSSRWYYGEYRTEDVVELWESIHLSSRQHEEDERLSEIDPEKCDGRHSICVEGAMLFDEHYYEEEPPFAFVRAVKPVRGFWGESLVLRAETVQAEVNKLSVRVQDSMHLHARPIIFLPRQAKIVKAHITNKVGAVVEYDGPVPPTQFTPASMSSDVYAYISELKQEVYGLMGVSELSARSLKPTGLNSGVALDTYNDVQSRRMISLERSYEELYVGLAQRMVCLEKYLSLKDSKHEVVYENRRTGERDTIKWRDIDLAAEAFRVRVFPASAFPTNPAHKIQVLDGMLERGVIDHQSFYELALDVPDLESVRNRIVAPLELLHKRFDQILEDGDYWPPEPYMDLQLGFREVILAIQRAEVAGAPEDNLDLLRQWMDECSYRLDQAQPMPMPATRPEDLEAAPGLAAPEASAPMPMEMMS